MDEQTKHRNAEHTNKVSRGDRHFVLENFDNEITLGSFKSCSWIRHLEKPLENDDHVRLTSKCACS